MQKHHAPCNASTLQHTLLASAQTHTTGNFFLPAQDHCSRQARRNALRHWFFPEAMDLGLVLALLVFKIALTPAIWLFVRWRCTRPQAGWVIDFDSRTLHSVRQTRNVELALHPEMGLLAHGKVIEITHPTQGPLLTLFTATHSSTPQDRQAQEALTRLLAQKLGLRLVGCRVNLA
jgi:hypothetical protein